jgi:hypothetical protein
MEVGCGSESFMVAGTPCQRHLENLQSLEREINKAVALALGKEYKNT